MNEKKRKIDELIPKYRYMFEKNHYDARLPENKGKPFHSIRFGMECDDGWYELLDELMGKIVELDPKKEVSVAQIKEKLGGLRFYIDGAPIVIDVLGQGTVEMGKSKTPSIHSLIHEYEDKSYYICEVCGEPGQLCSTKSKWLKTVCKEHRKLDLWGDGAIQEYLPVAKFREECVVIFNDEVFKVDKKDFVEKEDKWRYTLTCEDKPWTVSNVKEDEIEPRPWNKYWEGWYVRHEKTEGEYAIVSKKYKPKLGWIYGISRLGTEDILPDLLEEELEAIRDEEGDIRRVKDEMSNTKGS